MTELDDAKHALSVMRRGVGRGAYGDGIREGERRMLRMVFIGAACAEVMYGIARERTAAAQDPWWANRAASYACDARLHGLTARAACERLRDLGDEDASRVLGERGW